MGTEFYRNNQRYAETLRDSDPRQFQSFPWLCSSHSFHQKYANALSAKKNPEDIILDVGCGAGQSVRLLAESGLNAHGIDVSESSISLAREYPGKYQVYDGLHIPFADCSVDAIGAMNVLEHVEDPIALLDEMNRVLRPGGRMVISSPNFLRVFGWCDYHPHMRGILQKCRNLKTLHRHAQLYTSEKQPVFFEKIIPIQREPPQPDDDAIIATNSVDFRQYFFTRNYTNINISCVDRPLPIWLETLLDATPLRFYILNCFVTAEKPTR